MRKNYFGRELDLGDGDERSEEKEDEHETRWNSPQVEARRKRELSSPGRSYRGQVGSANKPSRV